MPVCESTETTRSESWHGKRRGLKSGRLQMCCTVLLDDEKKHCGDVKEKAREIKTEMD